MTTLTDYEQRAAAEILAWRDKEDSVVSRAVGMVGTLVGRAAAIIPKPVTAPVMKAALGAVEALRDASRWTYSANGVLTEARALGLEIESVRQLHKQDMEQLDRLARRFFGSNKMLALLEGAGMGFGGFYAVAADIPLLFGLAFRCIQQIGTSYGFDMEDPEMRPVVLSVLGAGAGASAATKARALLDMAIAAEAFASKWTYDKVAELTVTGVAAQALKKATQGLPHKIAGTVTKRKLAQAIPVVGAFVGAGFNYWFLSTTAESAYMIFRELHLQRRRLQSTTP